MNCPLSASDFGCIIYVICMNYTNVRTMDMFGLEGAEEGWQQLRYLAKN